MKLLHVDSSILGDNSASRAVTREIVARLRHTVPGLKVDYLDLAAQELPHFSAQSLAPGSDAANRDAVILEQFQAADILVIGAPMYNFALPSQLKAWIDRIVVAGKTFRYGPNGPEGLAKGKRAIVAISRGGVYPENAAAEHAESYLRIIFGFVGVTDLTFVRAEGLALSPEHRQKGLDAALTHAKSLAA
ncbi:MAG TPA: NAD(P)H-dependent oxidoreductase [Steroidobacteraceae bacterium]|nr:NAD(P)H-dependent oxidoreductase [Steroidobacteraceae bacterium]